MTHYLYSELRHLKPLEKLLELAYNPLAKDLGYTFNIYYCVNYLLGYEPIDVKYVIVYLRHDVKIIEIVFSSCLPRKFSENDLLIAHAKRKSKKQSMRDYVRENFIAQPIDYFRDGI